MARVPTKHGRDHMDFQGFLNDLQDWELSLKDKDKKMRPRGSEKSGGVAGVRNSTGRSTKFDDYNASGSVSGSIMAEEDVPNAASEKELGNEYFKQKKFEMAVECYSRSIAFSPTAVAYANRAMAYIKLRRFQEAEEDCTEALNLDDRYIKAYSRRATARKELGKLKESVEDAEFALRLEPENKELKKQYTEAKSLYDKEMLKKVSGAVRKTATGAQNREYTKTKTSSNESAVATIKENIQKNVNGQTMGKKKPLSVEEVHGGVVNGGSKHDSHEVACTNGNDAAKFYRDSKSNHRAKKQELNPKILESASRAASRAAAEAAKNITPPTSAFQFEVSWRGLSADRTLQARLLKVTSPSALPQIFKNALSAPILLDIVECVATFFLEDMDLAVKYLEYLTKVPRFDMLIMCLSSTEKTDLLKKWDEVFNKATPIEYAEVLDQLRSKYCL